MPELPEVETVIRGLSKHLPNQTIKSLTAPAWPNNKHKRSLLLHSGLTESNAEGHKITSLERRGKGIIINLDNGLSFLIHLKMTGQLIYIPSLVIPEPARPGKAEGHAGSTLGVKAGIQKEKPETRLNFGHPDDNFLASMPSKHTRVIFELTPPHSPADQLTHSSNFLYFNDQRLFGWVKLLPTTEVFNDPFIAKLGPEPLTKDFNTDLLWATLKRRPNSNIKSIILDQSVTSGVGNIYADESLFTAGIRPTRLAKNISKPEADKLVTTIKDALSLGIKYSGTSISHYKTGEGATGQMQNHLNMYGRTDQPCPSCKNLVHKIRVAGRGTHYCPTCQK